MDRWVSTSYKRNGVRQVFRIPAKPIAHRDVYRLSTSRKHDPGDKLLLAACKSLEGHDFRSAKTKLSAINAVASANIQSVPRLARSLADWDKENYGGLKRLISRGGVDRASKLIQDIQNRTGTKYISALSKCLAYHNDGVWPLYDQWARKYIWSVIATIDAEEYWLSPSYVLYGEPGWSGLSTKSCLKDYRIYWKTIELLWTELLLPQKGLTIRDKEYVLWRLAQSRATGYNGKRRSKTIKLRS